MDTHSRGVYVAVLPVAAHAMLQRPTRRRGLPEPEVGDALPVPSLRVGWLAQHGALAVSQRCTPMRPFGVGDGTVAPERCRGGAPRHNRLRLRHEALRVAISRAGPVASTEARIALALPVGRRHARWPGS